ncbi:MAG: ParB/RepB/Spo0J family partition protein [Acetobacteraceae bacterium]
MTPLEKPSRLGRGLAALLGDSDATAASPEATQTSIVVGRLEPGPFQPRRTADPESLEELASSIRAHGILQPILARPHPQESSRYQIIAGERRWRAAQLAGLAEVPVLLHPLTDAEAMAAALIENLQRRDLNPMEEAEGYRRLSEEFHLTQEALSQSIGKSRSHVANMLRLLNLPASVQVELRKGTLSAGHARALLSHPDPERAVLAVIAQGLNVRQTEALLRPKAPRGGDTARTRTGAAHAFADQDADLHSVEKSLTDRLGLEVHITDRKGRGRLSIDYSNLDQLDWLIALLNKG